MTTSHTFEEIADNTQIIGGNVVNLGFTLVSLNGGTATVLTDAAIDGNRGLRIASPAAALATLRVPAHAADSAQQTAVSVTFRPKDAGGSSTAQALFMIRANGGRAISVAWIPSTGELRLLDASNSTHQLVNSGVVVDTAYRFELVADTGPDRSSGQYTARLYQGTTVLATSPLIEAADLRGPEPINSVDLAPYNAQIVDYDSVLFKPGTTEAGPWLPPLPTPVVTLGAKVNNTNVDTPTGTQVINWAAVGGAGSYDEMRSGVPPYAQGSFSVVQTGISSPHTCTAVRAGQALGVRAVP